jgi:hypothetical protein
MHKVVTKLICFFTISCLTFKNQKVYQSLFNGDFVRLNG